MRISRETIKAMDDVLMFHGPNCFEKMSLSDKYLIAAHLLRDDRSMDWMNQLVDNPIDSIIEHALRCQSPEATLALGEELKESIVKYYERTIRMLIQERIEEEEIRSREPRFD